MIAAKKKKNRLVLYIKIIAHLIHEFNHNIYLANINYHCFFFFFFIFDYNELFIGPHLREINAC